MRRFLFIFFLTFSFGGMPEVTCVAGNSDFQFFDRSLSTDYYFLMQDADGSYRVARLLGFENTTVSEREYISYRYFPNAWGYDGIENLYYREEEGKVYHYDPAFNQENLIFDFNLNKGDTFQFANGEQWLVTATSDTLLNNKKCKVINLESIDRKGVSDTWIESLGSVTFGLQTDYDAQKATPIGVCVMKGKYAFNIDTPTYKGGLAKIIITERTEEVDIKEQLEYEFNGSNLNVYGRVRKPKGSNFYVIATIKGNNIELTYFTTESYNESWWYVDFEAVLPGFEPGKYHITELYRANHDMVVKERDMNCDGTSGTSLNPALSHRKEFIHDLQGRRMEKAPQKGIYVQDGKKIVK